MSKYVGNRFGSMVPIGPSPTPIAPAVYNQYDQYYAQQLNGWLSSGIEATGGITNEYTDPTGNIYRSHTFLTSGAFTVSDVGDLGGLCDILVVGGGAGGNGALISFWTGAGGGAGGMAVATDYPVTTSPGSYPITVGAGGQASKVDPYSPNANYQAEPGSPSVFTNPSSPQTITGLGGGAGGTGGPGGGHAPTGQAGINGGSGGGGGPGPGTSSGGEGTQPTQNPGISNLTNYGNDGAAGDSSSTVGRAGGGGGAGGAAPAIDGNPAMTTNNVGGPGVANVFRFGPGSPLTYAAGGGVLSPSSGAPNPTGNFFVQTTGSGNGGGGGTDGPGGEPGGNGGPGCVVVRYKLGQVSGAAKASGGDISFYGGKTIHTFTSSGTMTFPTSFNETVEYVVIGGGGGGGQVYGGGGGAGAYRTGTSSVNASPAQLNLTVTVGAGGAGFSENNTTPAGPGGSVGNVGNDGSSSSINFPSGTITSAGGGGGGCWDDQNGRDGGSGGGGGADNPTTSGSEGGNRSGDPFPGTIGATPSNGWGGHGGEGGQYLSYGSGGGGGAGGNGESENGTGPDRGRNGGAGIQLPSTFRDPASTVGAPGPTSAPGPTFDTSGKYWVAGGGGGGIGGTAPLVAGGSGGGAPWPVRSYSGGGAGGYAAAHPNPTYPSALDGTNAKQGSAGGGGGSGGSGQGATPGTFGSAGSGGSGLVLVAYPT